MGNRVATCHQGTELLVVTPANESLFYRLLQEMTGGEAAKLDALGTQKKSEGSL